MRVLLGTPPWSFAELMGEKPRRHRPEKDAALIGVPQPLGILSIAATLEQAGHEVDIVDGYFESLPQILDRIASFRPDVVGLGTNHCLWANVKESFRAIKGRFPDVRTVVGGPPDTMPHSDCLADCPDLDFAVEGEGEFTMRELAAALADGGALDTIEGLIFRDNSGQVVTNAKRCAIQDLNALPFPSRDRINLERYIASLAVMGPVPFANVVTTRGCPHGCGFCPIGDSTTHGAVRMRNAESIVEEVSYLVERHGVRSINFYDDFPVFVLDRSEGERICHALIDKGYDLKWTMNVFTYGLDEAYLELLRKAGLWRVQCMGPSAVQKNADALQAGDRRGVSAERIARGVETIHRAGIETVGKFIVGIPGETVEEAQETIEFACRLPLDFVIFMPVPVFPTSPMYRDQLARGLLSNDPTTKNIFHIHYDADGLQPDQLQKLIRTAYTTFYFRPQYLVRRALALRSFEELTRYLRYARRVYYNVGRYVHHPAGHS